MKGKLKMSAYYKIKGTQVFSEEGHGANYYAFSTDDATAKYSEAFANIVLPTKLKNIPNGVSN
jgi:hypothetical protein